MASVEDGKIPVVLLQEHGRTKPWYDECLAGLRTRGWKAVGALAPETAKSGASSDTPAVVPSCVGVKMAPGQTSWDISPTGSAGRLSLALAQCGAIGSVACFSFTCGLARASGTWQTISCWTPSCSGRPSYGCPGSQEGTGRTSLATSRAPRGARRCRARCWRGRAKVAHAGARRGLSTSSITCGASRSC